MHLPLAPRLLALVLAAALLALAGRAPAQATRPISMELRAAEAFAADNWAAALPLLEKLAVFYADDPEKLGRIDEQIRVCRRALAAAATRPATRPADPQVLALERPQSPQRTPHARPADGQVLDLAIKDLGNFDYDTQKGATCLPTWPSSAAFASAPEAS